MKLKNLFCCAAAVFAVCTSAAGAVGAEPYEYETAYVSASAAAASASFTVPQKKVTIAHDGKYRIVPKASKSITEFSFKSSDKKVAKVSKKGLVVAVGAGKAIITCTASDDGTSRDVEVTVAPEGEDNFPQAVFYAEESCTMLTGETFRPTPRVSPRGCTYTVSYSSDDTSVATVDKTGTVTAVSPGVCHVTIYTSNGLSASVEIIVTDEFEEAEEDTGYTEQISPEFIEDSVNIAVGEKYRPGITVTDIEGIHFTSSDTSVVKVSNKGTLLGVADGVAEVTVSYGENFDTVTVYVGETAEYEEEYVYDEFGNLLPSHIEYEHSSDAVRAGNKLTPSIKIYPKGAAAELTFESSNPNVAKVSQKGTVMGIGEGTCEITATTSNGCTSSFTVTVYNELRKGIDISKWNGDIDWGTVSSNKNVEFVMIRASYGFDTEDIRLKQNVAGCEEYNIPYGFYHYLYAKNVEDALIEADFFLKTVRPYNPTYPLVLDIEESYYQEMSKQAVTDIVCAFMEKLEDAGYYAMIYTSASFYDDNFEVDRVKDYDTWVACWGDRDRLGRYFSHTYGMWQYSETGRLNGIPEDVDLNYCFKDYPYLINRYGLTGFNNVEPQSEDNDDISYYTEVYEVSE